MKVLLNLCLLLSLISPVVLLTCQRCLNVKGTECPKARNETCRPDSACRNSIFSSNEFHFGKVVWKSCTPSTSCAPGEYSLTTSGGGFMKMLVDCCTKYNCNKKPLEFPSEPMEPNGLECEGCQVYGQGTCEETEMVKCFGEHTKCISMQINFMWFHLPNSRIFRIKGCATPLICDQQKVKKNMNLRAIAVDEITVNCTDAILSPSVSSLA